MLNINQQKNVRFLKKVATDKGFAGIGGGMGWGDRMGLGWVVAKINLHSVNFTRARMAQDRRWTYQLGNHTPERSKPLHGAGMAIDGRCGLDATGVVFIPQSALQMGNSVAKM